MDVYELHRGSSPLIVSMPHSGTALSPGLEARLSEAGREVATLVAVEGRGGIARYAESPGCW